MTPTARLPVFFLYMMAFKNIIHVQNSVQIKSRASVSTGPDNPHNKQTQSSVRDHENKSLW